MSVFERYLSLWVALCIGAGILLGKLVPGLFETLASWEAANVNFAVAVLIWAMVYPMMVGVDLASLARVGEKPKGLAITLAVNWLVKPFTMAALGVLFFKHIFAGLIPPDDADGYIAGLILLGAAPCTAMVFVWSQLTRGDPAYTLAQVSVNDAIMVFAYAPIVALLLGVTDIAVPWATLLLSVGLYVAIPLAAGIATRSFLMRNKGEAALAAYTARLKPYSMVALLAMIVLLFGFQAQTILDQPFVIGLIAVPLLLQSYGIFVIAVRSDRGRIGGSETAANWSRHYFGATKQLMNPLHQNFKNVEAVKHLLQLQGTDTVQAVHSVIAFNRVAQFASSMPANVMFVDATAAYIRQFTDVVLTEEQVSRFAAVLKQASTA